MANTYTPEERAAIAQWLSEVNTILNAHLPSTGPGVRLVLNDGHERYDAEHNPVPASTPITPHIFSLLPGRMVCHNPSCWKICVSCSCCS